jgi:Fe-S-cluster containining protein
MNFCKGCKASCCRDYTITITSFDVLRIMEHRGIRVEDFAVVSPARLLNQDEDTVLECYEDGERYDYILSLKSHPCIFLAPTNKCTIHDFAPLVCRMYPYNSAGRMHKSPRCPPLQGLAYSLLWTGGKKEDYQKQIFGYKRIVSKWNSKKGKLKECMDFLLKESRKIRIQ